MLRTIFPHKWRFSLESAVLKRRDKTSFRNNRVHVFSF